jgi:hypothetical protein
VQIEKFTDTLELNMTDRGDITLRPGRTPLAKIDARTHIGQIDLALPEAAKFDLKASTNRGELNNDFGPSLKTSFQAEHNPHAGGEISGTVGQGPRLVLATDRGAITIRKDSGEPLAPPHPPAPPKSDKVDITIEKQ